MPVPEPFTVGCLFAAMGGFCRAFQKAGARTLWANELDDDACTTFTTNYPTVRLIPKSVERLQVDADALEPVDVMTGGFPCQPFSEAGLKKGLDDDRGRLFLEVIRLLREFGDRRPKVLLLENVRHFRNHDDGRTFHELQTELQRVGYWFPQGNAQVLDTATHTTIPQNRKRVFMVALNSDWYTGGRFDFPDPLPKGSLRPVREFLDLREKADEWYYFTEESQYHPMFVEQMAQGGDDKIYQLRRNYVRWNRSGLCFTLMANMGDGGHNQPVIRDRWGIRKLTVRECARLQGFDDSWFVMPASILRKSQLKQIGNSVTVPLVARIAERCIATLRRARFRERRDAVAVV